jgi:Zn finger protein HypA/HybF involved in hydrogenase expression
MKNISDDKIIEACNASSSMDKASKNLNVSIRWLKTKAKKLNCWFPNLGGKNIAKFPHGHPKKIFTLEKWNNNELINIARAALLIQIKKHNLIEYKCQSCNINKWKDEYITLDLDHINGIKDDHRKDNLRFLCPNCHSQTSTFRNKKR